MRLTEKYPVIPDTRSVIRDPGAGTQPFDPLGSGFGLRPPRNDGDLICAKGAAPVAAALSLLLLSACASYPIGTTPPHRLPTQGQIAYACANGAHLLVEFVGDEARIAVAGGPSMVLPRAGEDYFSNGRYAIRGSAAQAQWEVGRAAPVNCRGN